MRSLVIVAAALVVWGANPTFAQQVGAATGARPSAALGAISTGPLGSVTARRLGGVVPCATSGAPPTLFNGSTADPLSGALPPPLVPGATIPMAPTFGASSLNGTCDPTASTRAEIESLGSSVAVTLPGLASISGSTYGSATTPATATEVGDPGLSPQIVVPTQPLPSATTCVGDATMPMITTTDPTTLAMGSGMAVAASAGVSSPSGC